MGAGNHTIASQGGAGAFAPISARDFVEGRVQIHGATLEISDYEIPDEEGAIRRVYFTALVRLPNRWRRDTWNMYSTEGASPDEALLTLAAELGTGDDASPCTLCGCPGAHLALTARAIDDRHFATGRVLEPGTVFCALCFSASLAVEDLA